MQFPQRLLGMQPLFHYWTLERFIGEGSFAKVYLIKRGTYPDVDYAALKWIPLPTKQSEIRGLQNEGMNRYSIEEYYANSIKEIQNEVNTMMRLRGNNHVVRIEDYDFVKREKEIGWDVLIQMELLTPLPEIIKQGMTVGDVVKLGIHILDALILCERNQIIHRDIKPDNIFCNEYGDYKLGDFGIARQLQHENTLMTRKGTPLYIAPEIFNGKKSDFSVDQYSLGLVMHRLLNGQQIPFTITNNRIATHEEREQALNMRLQGNEIPPPIQGGRALAAVIGKACQFHPQKRYSSHEAFCKALMRVQGQVNNKETLMIQNYFSAMNSGRSSLDAGNAVVTHSRRSIKKFIGWVGFGSILFISAILIILFFSAWQNSQDPVSEVITTLLSETELHTVEPEAATVAPSPVVAITQTPMVALQTNTSTFESVPIVTPTPTIEVVNLLTQIYWDDKNNQFSMRPESISLQLLADNIVQEIVTVDAAQNWSYYWGKLPMNNEQQPIVYTIKATVNDYDIVVQDMDIYAELSSGVLVAMQATPTPTLVNTPTPTLVNTPTPMPTTNVKAGDMIVMGTYEQSEPNEPIEWHVLEVFPDQTAVLLSKYILECKPFDDNAVTWEDSTLRNWLNNDFLYNAFTEQQREALLAYDGDFVFIPTLEDMTNSSFGFSANEEEYNQTRSAYGTSYAVSQGLWQNKDGNNKSSYYTRTKYSEKALCQVRSDGRIGFASYDRDNVGVRPLVYIDLNKFHE